MHRRNGPNRDLHTVSTVVLLLSQDEAFDLMLQAALDKTTDLLMRPTGVPHPSVQVLSPDHLAVVKSASGSRISSLCSLEALQPALISRTALLWVS